MKPFYALGKRGQINRLKRLAEKALGDFELREATLTPLEHMANTTFRVDTPDGERYVMRIQTPATGTSNPGLAEGYIRSEMEWLAALHCDTDLVVPVPVRARDGNLLTIVEVEGVPETRACVLFRWIEGRFLDESLSPEHLEQVGRFTARLHEHAGRFVPSESFTRRWPDRVTDELVEKIVAAVSEMRPQEDVELARKALASTQSALAELGTGLDAYGLIHADLHQANYLFHNGEVRAIDFDDCGYAHFIYDLAVTLSEVANRDNYPEMRAALLKGYRSVRPLPEEHEAYLPVLMAFRELQLVKWFIEERDHPAFENWEEYVSSGFAWMKKHLDERELHIRTEQDA